MWTVNEESLSPDVVKLVVRKDDAPASYAEVLEGLWMSRELRDTLIARLAAVPFEAFFWETPPVTASTQSQPFECVAVDSPELALRTASPAAFDDHLDGAPEEAATVTFDNLGGDATLVVPTLRGDDPGAYTHLATFLRQAPSDQVHALFEALAMAVGRAIGEAPLWVSTAGLGVSWLHVRLDSRPKYYTFAAYRDR